MTSYLMIFTSYNAAILEDEQRSFLDCLHHVADVFPVELQLSEQETNTIHSSAGYLRSEVPDGYRIDGDDYRIPLYSPHRRLEIVFVESSNTRRFPAQVQLTIEALEESGLWPLSSLMDLVEQVVSSFPTESVHLCEATQLEAEVYNDRICTLDLSQVPLGIFWFNYFSKTILRNIGREAVDTILQKAAISRSLPAGLIFATQESPFCLNSPEDTLRLRELESTLDYPLFAKQFSLGF